MRGMCAPPWFVPHIGRVVRHSAGLGVTWLLVGIAASLTAVPCGHAQDAVPSSRQDGTLAHHASRPNIIVVVVDDLGVGDVGFCHGRDIATPNLDQLAREGAVFAQGYVLPMCSPTRAALLTGRYPQRFGIEDNRLLDGRATGMDIREFTLAQALHKAGYVTHLVGKWHLGQGAQWQFAPYHRGFDHFLGFYGAAGTYFDPLLSRNGTEQSFHGYNTDILTDAACEIVADRAQRGAEAPPFFLHLAYLAAHLPQQAKPDDLARYAHLDPTRRMAAAIIHNLDENIGRLMQSIQDNGMDDRTLLFFLSDNGGEPPILGTSNGPLRGQKFDLYEGAIRVPFLARWPGHIPAATQFEPMVHVTDIFPTALAAAGHKPSGELDGVDLLPILQGKITGRPHERLYWLTTDHAQWRRPDRDTNDAQRMAAMRLGEWKLIDLGSDRPQLYRIPSDPAEAHDLAAAEPNRVQQMLKELNAWRESMTPQVVPSDHPIYGRAALQRKGP